MLLKAVGLQKHLSSLERQGCSSQLQLGLLAPETVFYALPVTAVNLIRGCEVSHCLLRRSEESFFQWYMQG